MGEVNEVHLGEVAAPQEPAGRLFDGENLPLGRVRVHPPPAENRQMLEGPLVAADPAERQRRAQPLIVGIGVGQVAVIGEPVELGPGPRAGQRRADAPQLQVARRERGVAAGAQHVQVAVFAAEEDAAVGHGHRGRDGRLPRGAERPGLALAGKGHHIQPAVQAAVDGVLGGKDGGADGRDGAQHLGPFLAGPMAAQAVTHFRPAAVHVGTPQADGREAHQPRQIDGGFGAGDEVGFHFAAAEAEDFHPAGVVAAMPLAIDGAVGAKGLPEGGGVLLAGAVGDQPDAADRGALAGVLDPNGTAARGHHHRAARSGDVDGHAELVAPCGAAFLECQPLAAIPPVARVTQHLADEVPHPGDPPVGFQRIHFSAQGGEVHPACGDHRGAEHRFAAVDAPHHRPAGGIQHVVLAGHRAEVDIGTGHGGRGHVVAVGRPAGGRHFPQHPEAGRLQAPRHAGAIDHVHPSAGYGRRGEHRIAQGHRGRQAQRPGDPAVRHIARAAAIELGLGPVLGPRRRPVRLQTHQARKHQRGNHSPSARRTHCRSSRKSIHNLGQDPAAAPWRTPIAPRAAARCPMSAQHAGPQRRAHRALRLRPV